MDTQNSQIILDAGAALVDPVRDHGGIPYVAMPEGYSVNDLESLLPQLARKRAKVVMLDHRQPTRQHQRHGFKEPPAREHATKDQRQAR